MTGLQSILTNPFVQRVGWALLHFLWQGAAVAALLAGAMLLLRRRSPNLRYVVACAALVLMLLLPATTMWVVEPVGRLGRNEAESHLYHSEKAEPAPLDPAYSSEVGRLERSEAESHLRPSGTEKVGLAPLGPAYTAAPVEPAEPPQLWHERVGGFLRPALPWIVCGWLVGVLALSMWHVRGWMQVRRLRRVGVMPVGREITEVLARLCNRLGIATAVRAVESALVRVPTVVGWLKPMILLPASALTGLTSEQLEAVLAHELAHIRRNDYLINLLQTAAETLLFYHPAAWWVSARIRAERENCCDDLAVAASGRPMVYARALTAVAKLSLPGARLAIAADGGDGSGGKFLTRIRRIVGLPTDKPNSRGAWLAGAFTLLTVLAIVIALTVSCATDKTPTASNDDKATATKPGELPGVSLSIFPELAVKPFAILFQAVSEPEPEELEDGVQFTVQDFQVIELLSKNRLVGNVRIAYVVRPGQRTVRRDEKVIWLLGSPVNGIFWGLRACTDTPDNRRAVTGVVDANKVDKNPDKLLRPKPMLLPGSRIPLKQAVSDDGTVVAICKTAGRRLDMYSSGGVLLCDQQFEVTDVLFGDAQPGHVVVRCTQYEMSVLSLDREKTIQEGQVVIWIARKGQRAGVWKGVKALHDTPGNRRTVLRAADLQARARRAKAAANARVAGEVRKMLKSWHLFEERWVVDADVVVLGTGEALASAVDGEISHDREPLPTLRVQRVLKGDVRCARIVYRSIILRHAPYFIDGRSYLLFLKPNAEERKQLADPKGFNLPDGTICSNPFAGIDLSQKQPEAEFLAALPKLKPVRSGFSEGFTFTPAKWAEMRKGGKIDWTEQNRLIVFLENVVLKQGATILDVGAWLGTPDWPRGAFRYTYYLNRPAFMAMMHSGVRCDLRLTLHPDGSLAQYEILPLLETETSPGMYSDSPLPGDEMKRLGLRHVQQAFPSGVSPTQPATQPAVQEPPQKSIPQLISDLKSGNRSVAESAKWELGKRGKAAVPALIALVKDRTSPGRDLAVISLGIVKDPGTVSFLIQCLGDEDWHVRGRAAYSLSQIGGKEAKDALVTFLDKCLKSDRINLTKATESLKELPDPRAFSSLLSIVRNVSKGKRKGYQVCYAAQALGKIGDPQASEALVKLLDPAVPYSESWDYIYLEAIRRTKGQNAVPGLVAYLEAIVKKMKGLPHDPVMKAIGAESRQQAHNYRVYVQTLACLEAISAKKSKGGTREKVLKYWQDYHAELRRKGKTRESTTPVVKPPATQPAPTGAGSKGPSTQPSRPANHPAKPVARRTIVS